MCIRDRYQGATTALIETEQRYDFNLRWSILAFVGAGKDVYKRQTHVLFVWINQISYNIEPREKKILILEDEEVIYFTSTPGLFPVFGKEILELGGKYVWKFVQ